MILTSVIVGIGVLLYLIIGYGIELEYVKRKKIDPQDGSHIKFAWLFLILSSLVEKTITYVRIRILRL